jgi:hypothetical protein
MDPAGDDAKLANGENQGSPDHPLSLFADLLKNSRMEGPYLACSQVAE